MWSFWKVLRMCFSTAWSVMTSRAAMPLLERPSAISATTSRVDAQLLELSHSGGRERLAAELGQRCIAPELECIVQECGLALVVRRSPRFRPQLGKAVEVQDSALDVEDVPPVRSSEGFRRPYPTPFEGRQYRPAAPPSKFPAASRPRAPRSVARRRAFVCSNPGHGRPMAPPDPNRRPSFSFQVFGLDGGFIGTIHLIWSDLYRGQPCPQAGGQYFFIAPIGYFRCEHF